jgi:hypothetical protein
MQGTGYALSDISNEENFPREAYPFTNREIKLLLLKEYGDQLCITKPQEVNKSPMVFLTTASTARDMAYSIHDTNPIKESTNLIHTGKAL